MRNSYSKQKTMGSELESRIFKKIGTTAHFLRQMLSLGRIRHELLKVGYRQKK